ncbi:MAG: fibrobacter succinogenes major paralogous domain-containing protein [Flavobacteriales bacterium]|nr:fibrobacter succinogenes major paralogous domain-containing protein [Flavobacteriales bacterium]
MTEHHLPLGGAQYVLIALGLVVVTACKKEDQIPSMQTTVVVVDTVSIPPGSVADSDGNVYSTILVGGARWFAENLRSRHYENGDPIAYEPSAAQWAYLDTGAWSTYSNDVNYQTIYGHLYNWYSVSDPRNVCPSGWHVPTDEDWQTLELSLGMPVIEVGLIGLRGDSLNIGGKLKATVYWESPNIGANNVSGFSGLPGGDRLNNGGYDHEGYRGSWWTATEANSDFARQRSLVSNYSGIYRFNVLKEAGASVRCVKD